MKKFFTFFVVCAIFLIVGCGGSKKGETPDSDEIRNDEEIVDTDEPTNPTDEPTNPTDEPTNPTDEPTNPTDEPTNPTDEPTNPTDEPTDPTGDSDDPQNDSDSTDPTGDSDDPQNDSDSTDPTGDSDDPQNDSDSTDPTGDSDDPQNDSDSTDPTGDSDDPQNDNDSTDPTGDSDDPQNDDDADNVEPEIECTGFSLDASSFMPYYEGVYAGLVTDGILGDASLPDIIEVDFFGGVAVSTYTSSNYTCTGTACMFVTQDYGTEGESMYFQKEGTIDVSEYDPETFEMSASISSTLVEVVRTDSGFVLKNGGKCITIETGVVRAVEQSEKTETCADIYACIDECSDDDSDCVGGCYSNSTAVARTQYNALSQCSREHNCNGNFRCWYENCREEEEVCGMAVDSDYEIPYGHITISGTFPYLHAEPQSEEDKITISEEYVIMGAFVSGTFGNDNNIPVVDPEGAVFSYAQMSHFKAPNEADKNITFIQTYKTEEGKDPTPTVHLVTTITQSGDYTLGLGKWDTEARIFIKGKKSDGTPCDHAFGVGTLTISDLSFPGIGDVITGETTKITLSGEATLYSFKATPDYGGDVSDSEWVACDPE